MAVKVKICGITNVEDATWAVNLGANFIGFNFWPQSPRKISVKNTQEIIEKLPPFITTVGVFVDAPEADIQTILKKTGITYVQLHGNEQPDYLLSLKGSGIKIFKAFRLKDESELEMIAPYKDLVEYILADTFVEDVPGGTGQTGDWNIAQKITQVCKAPLFLAGGLSPENVTDAIRAVHPFGVDVCSGIEKSPRRKDYEKMKDFIINAQGAW